MWYLKPKFLLPVLLALLNLSVLQARAELSELELVQQIRADYAALLTARTELQKLGNSGNSAATEAADLSAWIYQLKAQVVRGCKELSMLSENIQAADLPCTNLVADNPSPAAIDTAKESTKEEKTTRMIEQLNGSLAEFDERLLQEQERVRTRAPSIDSTMTDTGPGSAGSGDGDSALSGSNGQKGSAREASRDAGKPQTQSGDGTQGQSSQSGTQGRSPPTAAGDIPKDIPDGSDDDVIARQLREAAEQEQDPELRKKLWDEYRRYRDAIR